MSTSSPFRLYSLIFCRYTYYTKLELPTNWRTLLLLRLVALLLAKRWRQKQYWNSEKSMLSLTIAGNILI